MCKAVLLLQNARKAFWWTPFWLVPGVHLVIEFKVLRALSSDFNRSFVLPVLLFLVAVEPFYFSSTSWLRVALVEYFEQGHQGVVLSLGSKSFIAGVLIAGVHVSLLMGCLPLGLTSTPLKSAGS